MARLHLALLCLVALVSTMQAKNIPNPAIPETSLGNSDELLPDFSKNDSLEDSRLNSEQVTEKDTSEEDIEMSPEEIQTRKKRSPISNENTILPPEEPSVKKDSQLDDIIIEPPLLRVPKRKRRSSIPYPREVKEIQDYKKDVSNSEQVTKKKSSEKNVETSPKEVQSRKKRSQKDSQQDESIAVPATVGSSKRKRRSSIPYPPEVREIKESDGLNSKLVTKKETSEKDVENPPREVQIRKKRSSIRNGNTIVAHPAEPSEKKDQQTDSTIFPPSVGSTKRERRSSDPDPVEKEEIKKSENDVTVSAELSTEKNEMELAPLRFPYDAPIVEPISQDLESKSEVQSSSGIKKEKPITEESSEEVDAQENDSEDDLNDELEEADGHDSSE